MRSCTAAARLRWLAPSMRTSACCNIRRRQASATILTVIVSLLVVAILRTVDIRKELTQ